MRLVLYLVENIREGVYLELRVMISCSGLRTDVRFSGRTRLASSLGTDGWKAACVRVCWTVLSDVVRNKGIPMARHAAVPSANQRRGAWPIPKRDIQSEHIRTSVANFLTS